MPSSPKQDVAAAQFPPSEEVHVGRDGWLFLTVGSNRVLEQYGRPGIARKTLWAWRRHLVDRCRRSARLGATYLHVVAPEKLSVYHDAVDGLAYEPERAPALRLQKWLRGSRGAGALVDLVGPMRAARWQAPLYRRTDSHWTFEGCELAYRTLVSRLGVPPRGDITGRRLQGQMEFVGDLGAKLSPPRAEIAQECRFETQARRIQMNPLLAHFDATGQLQDAHIGSHAVFRNEDPKADPRRLVLFGDSYSQHTAMSPVAVLTPFLADTFREVHFLWTTSIDWDYVARTRPDFLVSQIAERFMIEVPVHGMRIDALAQLAMTRKGIL